MIGFNDRLRLAMELRGESQSSLARQLELTQPEIHYYLKGKIKPRPIVRQKLAYVLKVSYQWLAWGSGELVDSETGSPFEEFHQSFEDRFIFLFWSRGISVQQLASTMEVSYNEIEYWMEGDRYPTEEKLDRVCEIFDVSRNWLERGNAR